MIHINRDSKDKDKVVVNTFGDPDTVAWEFGKALLVLRANPRIRPTLYRILAIFLIFFGDEIDAELRKDLPKEKRFKA